MSREHIVGWSTFAPTNLQFLKQPSLINLASDHLRTIMAHSTSFRLR